MNPAEIMAHQPMAEAPPPPVRRPNAPGLRFGPQAEAIAAAIAKKHGIELAVLRGPSARKPIVAARHEAMYAIYATRKYSTPTIGAWFGGRDHTTVLHGVRKHESRLRAEAEKAAA